VPPRPVLRGAPASAGSRLRGGDGAVLGGGLVGTPDVPRVHGRLRFPPARSGRGGLRADGPDCVNGDAEVGRGLFEGLQLGARHFCNSARPASVTVYGAFPTFGNSQRRRIRRAIDSVTCAFRTPSTALIESWDVASSGPSAIVRNTVKSKSRCTCSAAAARSVSRSLSCS
jgi:hypothetical protein